MAVLLSLCGCSSDDRPTAGRGTEAENEVYGALVDASGNAGKGAWVRAYPAAGFPLPSGQIGVATGVVDSVQADTAGLYSFKRLPAGTYNLVAQQERGPRGPIVAFIPQVPVQSQAAPRDLGVDTLYAPGAIKGRVTMGGAGKEGVMAYLPGTTYLAFSDGNGEFLATGVPKGRYAVHYLVPGLLAPPDTGVMVLEDDTTILPDKELGYDTLLAPPAPSRVKAVFDTLASEVRLEWSPIRVADLQGYLVYRDTGALSSPQLLSATIVTDTFYVDKVGALASLEPPPVATYRIVSIDREKHVSQQFSPPAQAALASPKSRELRLSLRELGASGNLGSVGDTLRIEVKYANQSRRILRVDWWITGSTSPVRTRADSSYSGADTLVHAWETPGRKYAAVVVTDENGPSPTHVWEVDIVVDAPKAQAGPDLRVYAGDTVRLQGTASQEFGSIASYAWDVGATGTFQDAPGGRLQFWQSAEPGDTLLCVFRVLDDDGNEGRDTLLIRFQDYPSIVALGPDVVATASDTIRLVNVASVMKPARWEWDLGGEGRFVEGPADTFFVTPRQDSGRIPCILRATADGRVYSDTIFITLVPDLPRAEISAQPASIAVGGTLRLSAAESRDQMGRIVAWEWKIGAEGDFVPGSGKDTIVVAPASGSSIFCVLRVTDDDGHTDTAAIDVPLLPRDTWSKSDDSADFEWTFLNGTRNWTGFGKVWLFAQSSDHPERILRSTSDFRTWETFPTDSSWVFNREPSSPMFELDGRLWIAFYNFETNSNEFWASEDGGNWKLVSQPAAFRDRIGFTIIVFGGKAYLMSGVDRYLGVPTDDAWSSRDGLTWEKIADNLPLGFRQEAIATVMNGRMWLFGGFDFAQGKFLKDVWSSPDGVNWTRAGEVPYISQFVPSRFASHDERLWVVESGIDSNGTIGRAWHSPDGITWSKDPDPPGFNPMEHPILVPLNGRLWLIGMGLESGKVEVWTAP